ncbi:MAG: metallophosphoesterase [bacterium]
MKTRTSLFLLVSLFIFSISRAQVDTLTILHINDTHSTLGTIGPRNAALQGGLGGIARVASYVGYTKMTEPNVLFLHAGDAFVGDLFFNSFFGVAELKLLLSLGLDAMAVGNHEFDLTPAILQMALDSAFTDAAFPMLSANINLEDPSVNG